MFRVDALFLGTGPDELAWLPEWLDRVQNPMPSDTEFLEEMGRRLDPGGYGLLEENLGLRPGESETSRTLMDYLWELAPGGSSRSLVTKKRPGVCRAFLFLSCAARGLPNGFTRLVALA